MSRFSPISEIVIAMDDTTKRADPALGTAGDTTAAALGAPVVGFSNYQWAPPTDWQHFERMCCALWRRIWEDPNTQMHGRPGQQQHGVDVYGTPKGESRVRGVQCKRKDVLLGTMLTEQEVLDEVENAKAFQPPLAELIIATCTASDVHLQALARQISEQHAAHGLFSVHIFGWPEIRGHLGEHPELIVQFYGLKPIAEPSIAPEGTKQAEIRHAEVVSGVAGIQQRLDQVLAVMATAAPADGPAHAQLDVCRQLLESHSYRAALQILEPFREREWAAAALRFRILTNLGAAHLGLGDNHKAGEYFLDAFQFDSTNDKAHTNYALGLMLLDRSAEALAAARQAVSQHPTSARTWTALVNIAPRVEPDAPIPDVPESLADEPQLLLVRADALAMRGAWGAAEALLRKLVSLPTSDVMARSRLAEVLMAQASGGGHFYAGAPYSAGDMVRLNEARDLLRQTWDAIKRSDLAAGATHVVQNWCALCTVVGEMRQAELLLDEALLIAPGDTGLLVWKTRIAAARGDGEAARRAFSRLPTAGVDEYALLEAATLRASRDTAGAADVLERFITSTSDAGGAQDARCMFADFVCEADLAYAAARFNALPQAGTPDVARSTLIFARALRDAGAGAAALPYLELAREQVSASTDDRDRLMLADALADFDDAAGAVAIYEKDVSTSIDTPSLREYFRCLFELDQRRRLTDLFAMLPPEIAAKPAYEYIRASLALRVGDLAEARLALESCLATHPDKMSTRLLWTDVCVRMNDAQAAGAWLDTLDLRAPDLTLDQLLRLGPVFHALHRPEDAAAAFYQALRRFPNDPRPHIGFAASLMLKGSTAWEPQSTTVVARETAVGLRDADGRDSYYILETLPEAQLQPGEVPADSAFASSLMGHRVGDVVLGHSSSLATHESTIISIQHKYARVLQESLRTFNTRFPDAPGLVGVKLPIAGTPEEQLAPILQAVKDKAERVKQIQGLYGKGLPFAALGVMLGQSAIEAWRGMMGRPGQPVMVCAGSVEEREAAFELLRTGKHRFILDSMALLELHFMAALDVVERTCGQLGVTQATLAELQGLISDLDLHPQGYSTIIDRDGEQFRHDISAEDVARERDLLIATLEWARSRCLIVPALPRVDPAPELADRLYETLGPAANDTLLAAAVEDFVLVSDDWHLRRLAKGEFKTEGIWIQAILLHALNTNKIKADHYNRTVSMLASWQHHFTTIFSDHLLFAARRGRWKVTPEFTALVSTLALRHSEFRSNLGVCVTFLKELWRKGRGPTRSQATALTNALLGGVDPGTSTNGTPFYMTLRSLAQRGVIPAGAWVVVDAWYRGRFLPPAFKI